MAINLVAVLKLQDNLTRGLKKAATAATVGFAAITAAAAVSTKKYEEFDTAIRKTGAIAGASASELQMLSDSALALGESTSKGATETANAMSSLASGGMDAQKIMKAMPGIIAASEASGESLAVASETVSSALSLWGLEAEKSSHVADVLAKAANVSAAGITDLGYAFKYAGSPAAALGISMEETAAAIGILSNVGIDGSSAGTSLRASLLALNNPAKDQAKMMDALGFSVTDAQGNFKSLSAMIGDMKKATEGLTEAEKVATLGKLVGTEAVSGFLALIKAGPEQLDSMTDSLRNSGGTAAETAKQMMGGIGGALEEAGGAIETLMIKIGEALAPTVVKFADFIAAADFSGVISMAQSMGETLTAVASYIVDNWSGITETVKNVTFAVIALSAAIFTFKAILAGVTVVKTVIALYKAWRAGTLAATAAQLGFNTALWLSPITWIAAGIALLVGAAVLLALKWRDAAGSWGEVWRQIKAGAATAINFIIDKINWMIEVFNKIPGINIPIIPKVDWGNYYAGPTSSHAPIQTKAAGDTGAMMASHYHGLTNVPYDGYCVAA